MDNRLLTSNEEWVAFDTAMKASAKENRIKKKDYNDYCLMFSEDPSFWGVVAEIKIAQDTKTRAETLKEIEKELFEIVHSRTKAEGYDKAVELWQSVSEELSKE